MFESVLKFLSGGFVKDIGDAIDKNVTSDAERMGLRNELAKITAAHEEKLAEFAGKYENELTERHKADMQSDDKLAKRIRPGALIFLLVVVSGLAIASGWDFKIDDKYVDLFESLLLVAFGFYFGGRSLEKIAGLVMGARK